MNTAAVSDSYPTLITPIGFTFAIWGVIYFLLGVFAVYQALPGQGEKEYHRRIDWLFVLVSIANIAWIFLWQYGLVTLLVPVMVVLLIGLILIYTRLGIGKTRVPLKERIAIHLPFSIYLGWITIASMVNVAVALVAVNWGGFGVSHETWAIIIIVIALLLALTVIAARKDVAYGLVIAWALFGIASKQANPSIVATAQVGIIVILIASVAAAILAKPRKP